MNNVSLFLYFADVLVSLDALFFGLSTITFFGGSISLGVYTALCTTVDNRAPKKWPYFLVVFFFLFFAIAQVVIPSKETIYMIAGSELTQQVAASEQGQKILGKLDAILDEYTKVDK